MSQIDQARAPREGEALDVQKLEAWLRDNLPELSGRVEVAQFPGGASNLTYLVRIGSTQLVLRRPPFGANIASAHDMGREYRVLSRLNAVFAPAPRPLAYCEDKSVMGAPFYVMQRIEGVILRRELPAELGLGQAGCRQLSEALLDTLLDLHSVDYAQAGLSELGKPEGYVERQIRGWDERWDRARTEDVADVPAVRQWLFDKLPGDSGRVGIIHNDYKFDNVILDPAKPTGIIGVLDWEMATLGDPLMDLGCAMSYWVQADDPQPLQIARMGPTNEPGMLTRQQMIDRYAQRASLSLENFDFYYVFGLFRLAVIVQQIYRRYYEGKTRDPRFAVFGQMATMLNEAARATIAKSDL